MTWAVVGPLLVSGAPSRNAVVLIGDCSSPCTGLDALHPAGRCMILCLFGALSSARSFSFSFSILASYGDLIGAAFPTGPFGVPRRLFSDLWRSWDAARAALFGATDEGRWNGRTVAEGVGRIGGSLVGVFVFFASIGARSVCVMPMASATSTKTPLSRLSSSPSCSSLLSFQYVSPTWFRAWSHTMTRLLKVWNLRYPSCHRFCFRLTSCVKRHRNSATGAVCDAGSAEACGVLRRGAVIALAFG
jgi:hypothetical protein